MKLLFVNACIVFFLISVNLALAVGTVLDRDEPVFFGLNDEEETVVNDDVFVQAVDGHFAPDETRLMGQVTVINAQTVPVEGVVVTLQLVVNNRTAEITQVKTGVNGVAEFVFPIESTHAFWIEVIDVFGAGAVYVPRENKASRLLAQEVRAATVEGEGTEGEGNDKKK